MSWLDWMCETRPRRAALVLVGLSTAVASMCAVMATGIIELGIGFPVGGTLALYAALPPPRRTLCSRYTRAQRERDEELIIGAMRATNVPRAICRRNGGLWKDRGLRQVPNPRARGLAPSTVTKAVLRWTWL